MLLKAFPKLNWLWNTLQKIKYWWSTNMQSVFLRKTSDLFIINSMVISQASSSLASQHNSSLSFEIHFSFSFHNTTVLVFASFPVFFLAITQSLLNAWVFQGSVLGCFSFLCACPGWTHPFACLYVPPYSSWLWNMLCPGPSFDLQRHVSNCLLDFCIWRSKTCHDTTKLMLLPPKPAIPTIVPSQLRANLFSNLSD